MDLSDFVDEHDDEPISLSHLVPFRWHEQGRLHEFTLTFGQFVSCVWWLQARDMEWGDA